MSENYVSSADKSIEVPFSDDEAVRDDELILDEDSPNLVPAERITRKQKRSERIKRLLDEGKQSKEEVSALKASQEALKNELAQLKGYVAAQQQSRQAPQADDGKDEYQRALDAVYEKQSSAWRAYQAEIRSGEITPERVKFYEGISREVEAEKSRIHSEQAVARTRAQLRAEQEQQPWRHKYPEVYQNPSAYKFAQATWERRKALGEKETHELLDEVMTETLTQFKLRKPAGPTVSERSRLGGIPSSGGGSGGSAGIPMTKELRKMATALYSDLSEEEAVKKWANTAGKQLRKDKVL